MWRSRSELAKLHTHWQHLKCSHRTMTTQALSRSLIRLVDGARKNGFSVEEIRTGRMKGVFAGIWSWMFP